RAIGCTCHGNRRPEGCIWRPMRFDLCGQSAVVADGDPVADVHVREIAQAWWHADGFLALRPTQGHETRRGFHGLDRRGDLNQIVPDEGFRCFVHAPREQRENPCAQCHVRHDWLTVTHRDSPSLTADCRTWPARKCSSVLSTQAMHMSSRPAITTA